MQHLLLFLALAAPLALADSGYGGYAPKYYCRDTNTSIYAEVCVPGFTSEAEPVVLNVKNIVDDQYCYTQSQTQCEETTKTEEREICTYTYISKREKMPATTTQVTYEEKKETMKVTTCAASGYNKPHGYGHDSGEHQYCREEYQTQEYRVPLVNVPLEVEVEVAVPEPVKNCVTKTVELTEVVCNDVEKEVCIDLAKYEDGTVSIDQTKVVLGEPNCKQVTLTLPTEVCSKKGYGH